MRISIPLAMSGRTSIWSAAITVNCRLILEYGTAAARVPVASNPARACVTSASAHGETMQALCH